MKEIERKFILKDTNIPTSKIIDDFYEDGCVVTKKYINQFYLYTGKDRSIRVRKVADDETRRSKYYLTCKQSREETSLCRREIEYEVSQKIYDYCRNSCNEYRDIREIKKTRYDIIFKESGRERISIDVFPDGLRMVEVEFDDIDSAKKYNLPTIMKFEEVSDNINYRNENICKIYKKFKRDLK